MDKEQIKRWAFEVNMEGAPADDNCRVPHFDDVTLEELEAFAKLVRDDYSNKHAQLWLKRIDEAVRAERNKLAAWMIQFGFATGHGDTMEELCDALGTEIVDRIDGEVDAAIRARNKE
jgi:hypothetical protein